ncbi:MAG: bifunctional 4-hydroxy-3-methylbut-2-enyl diphosphate reductase/30S ribosomal protein S1 [Peptococcaceae bacterium]|nr:bifunctional 4-hydroxy-3-methylbut-2-enyl diphosphate reductase/30S ribosomal protein S1 [Peptococcaceae bacterium]
MEVIVAEGAGFCYGVKRAVELARKCAAEGDGPVYSLGPVIHNRQVVDELARAGIKVIEEISQAEPGSKVIIRSHGVSPEVLEEAGRLNLVAVDATCPFVAKAQKIARDITAAGIQAVVVGDAEHPEVKGIVGWSGGKAMVLENPEQARMTDLPARVGVLAQTTQTQANFEAVVNVIKEKCQEADIYNTICHSTAERQKSTVELARDADVMVVVGGRNSSNTAKLTALCAAGGTVAHQVETAAELEAHWFEGKLKAGLTAGASTPQWIIEEVERRMKELGEMAVKANEEILEPGKELEIEASAAQETPGEPVKEAETEASATQEEPVKEEGMGDAVDVKSVRPGEIVTGVVVQVNPDEVLVDIGAKSEGVIPLRELSCYEVASPHDVVKVGDKIDVFVVKAEDNEGRLILSKEKADAEKAWATMDEYLQNGQTIEGTVREVVKGGLLVDVGVRAFLPASLVDRGYVEDLSKFLGQRISAKVIELNRARKKVILSRKAVVEEEYARKREELLNSLQEKQVVRGIVRRLTNFGAFVDIGGIDGLLHISEMAWHRVNHPSEVVKVGDEVDVMILRIDREKEKISLGLKQVLPNPWDNVAEKYPVGKVVQAKVVRLASFGAFVQLEPGVEGLVHISHLADRHVEKPDEVVKEGEEIAVKVLSVDPAEKRIRLSLREVDKGREKEARAPKGTGEPKLHEAGEGGNVTIGDLVGDIFEQK